MKPTNPAFSRKGLNWTLEDEVNYLDHMGTGMWCWHVQKTRTEMLRSYIDTIHYRKDTWVSKAREYAQRLLIAKEDGRG